MRSHSYQRASWLRAALALAISFSAASSQALNLPKIFSDHMVLQREIPLKIWGWAEAGEEVTVSFAGQSKPTKAAQDGKWTAELTPLPASAEPRELTVSGGGKKVVIKNILVGEVWICSGQSNMEWTLDATDQGKSAISESNYPLIRQFKVPHVTHTQPQKDLPGEWFVCSPNVSAKFTAVGYHFGLELHKKLNVPIGLINTSWGGTRIEPWTDPEGFKVSPQLSSIVEQIAGADQAHKQNQLAKLTDLEAWTKQSREAIQSGKTPTAFPGGLPEHPLLKADKPTSIYNAMIAPLVPFGIRGAIWYQGESNNGEGMLYTEKMKALIGSWRRLWAQGDFPFLFVQLAPYRYNRPEALPGIWEAQQASLSIPNTGMAVITDIGNVTDIHPRNKSEVGRRLSLWALSKTYGVKDLVYSGPLYKSSRIEGSKIIVNFDHAEGLKTLNNNPVSWFTIAGDDKKFVAAKAEIVGSTIVVSADGITQPAAARFAWNEVAEPNLANGAGLPASPFRTDRW